MKLYLRGVSKAFFCQIIENESIEFYFESHFLSNRNFLSMHRFYFIIAFSDWRQIVQESRCMSTVDYYCVKMK